ncbi:MAG: hypothetical protein EBT55_02485 [Proteobacteria bacterium]|jgi:hypothetical protein|nr:hypothetical protein [Pseudomonadota bacterium]
MGTKNNPKNRKVLQKRKFQGKEIEPTYYQGNYAGHGNYMSAKYSNTTQLVIDQNGLPMHWKNIPRITE